MGDVVFSDDSFSTAQAICSLKGAVMLIHDGERDRRNKEVGVTIILQNETTARCIGLTRRLRGRYPPVVRVCLGGLEEASEDESN